LRLGRLSTRQGADRAAADTNAGEFLLPYQVVRTAPDPDATLLAFGQSTYDARRTSRIGSELRPSADLTNSIKAV
jgi:hypothetical protein